MNTHSNFIRSCLQCSLFCLSISAQLCMSEAHSSALSSDGVYPVTEQPTIKPVPDNFNVRLYAQNENLLIHFSSGNRIVFTPEHNQFGHRLFKNKIHTHAQFGHIETSSSKRIWHSNQTMNIEFLGSYPIAVTNNGHRLNLNYEQQQLVRADFSPPDADTQTPAITQALLVARVNALLEQVDLGSCPSEQDQHTDEQCQNPYTSLPVGFNESASANQIPINSRPYDCESFFTTFPSIERGTAIEAALAHHWPYLGSESGAHSFPVADFWNNGQVYVLISRDLTADSYNPLLNADALYEQLMADGQNIQENLIQPLAEVGEISHTEQGQTTTLFEADAQVIYLDVVVQYGVITPAQQSMFDRAAAELLNQYGIILRQIMIP